MSPIPLIEFVRLGPEIFLATAGMVMLLISAFKRNSVNGYRGFTLFAVIALAATGGLLWTLSGGPSRELILAGMFVIDGYALFLKVLLLAAAILTVFLSERFLADGGYRPGEFYALILFATCGMLLMVSSYHLLTIWISLELMALSSYILAGYFKHQRKSNEAALKYYVLGALSSGVLLYGVSLLYGATGALRLDLLATALRDGTAGDAALLVAVGWLMLAIGLFFKVAVVPFHIWTPDVYVGAPTPVTSYLAAASKVASFAILIRIFFEGLTPLAADWQWVTAGLAMVTMIWGNVAALTQKNVKRMLAYSSIAHAGYILIGVLAATGEGLWAVLFYLLAYTFITVGVFGTVILLERREYAGETYEDYAGLARRSPFLAAMMLLFMLALTGIPPTGGFVGKIYLFAAAVEAGWVWVAVVGVLTSAISLYFYLGLVVQMYLKDAGDTTPRPLYAPGLLGTIALCAVVTLALGLIPGPFIDLAKASLIPLP